MIIPPNQAETQLLFFYDLGAKIISARCEPQLDQELGFEWRIAENSRLSKTYFTNNIISNIVSAHFHLLADNDDNNSPIIIDDFDTPYEFNYSEFPCGTNTQEDGYSPIECTLFTNGNLVVTLRLTNVTPIPDSVYLDCIRRPENIHSDSQHYKAGALLEKACKRMDLIEQKLSRVLHKLSIDAVVCNDGISRKLIVVELTEENQNRDRIPVAENKESKGFLLLSGTTKIESGNIYHRLRRSRPYVGTIINYSDNLNNEAAIDPDWLRTLAIACGRTTPEFLGTFVEPKHYLEEGSPPRNIYDPGPSIVFIGRRGWCCLIRDSREDDLSFQLGVIETTLFAIQAIFSSTRAMRRFLGEVIRQSKQLELVATRRSLTNDQKVAPDTLDDRLSAIKDFTVFLERIRLASPYNDPASTLGSHISTHTGIAAVQRVKQLTQYETLSNQARDIVNNYGSVLDGAAQHWTAKQTSVAVASRKSMSRRLLIAVIALVITMFSSLIAALKFLLDIGMTI